jgi:hypothetical protein
VLIVLSAISVTLNVTENVPGATTTEVVAPYPSYKFISLAVTVIYPYL